MKPGVRVIFGQRRIRLVFWEPVPESLVDLAYRRVAEHIIVNKPNLRHRKNKKIKSVVREMIRELRNEGRLRKTDGEWVFDEVS